MANLGGRPTDYSLEILNKAQKYLKQCKDEVIENKLRVDLPSIEGLAIYLKVHRDTLYEWAKIHPGISDTLEEIKAEQAKRLLNKGLSGEYNSTIAKLILSSNHGMKEKTDVTTNDKDIPTPIYGGKAL